MIKLLLLASLAYGQQGSIVVDRFLGLNDTDSSAVIPSAQAQAMLNVESNQNGTSIKKRKGYSTEANLTLSSSAVNGSAVFNDASGDNIRVVCHDSYCSKSENFGGFTNFLTTASPTTARWMFVNIDGFLYGANDQRDPILKYNGTISSHPASIPAGSLITLSEDRMIIADFSNSPNRIHYSKSGDFINFSTGPQSTDSFFDDLGTPGDKVTGITYYKGVLYVFKSDSITTCILGDQYTTDCKLLTSQFGSVDPLSVVEAPDALYFKGSDRNFWKVLNRQLAKVSDDVKATIQTQSDGKIRSNIDDTFNDWSAGSRDGLGERYLSVFGSVIPTTSTFLDTDQGGFNSGTNGNVNFTDTSGDVVIQRSTGTKILFENWSQNDCVAEEWTVFDLATCANTDFRPSGAGSAGLSRVIGDRVAFGLSFTYRQVSAAVNNPMVACVTPSSFNGATCDGDSYSLGISGSALTFKRNNSVKKTALTTISPDTDYEIAFFMNAQSKWTFLKDGVAFDTYQDSDPITGSNRVGLHTQSGGAIFDKVGDVSYIGYDSKGIFTSRIFNTGISTPVAEAVRINQTKPGSTAIVYAIRSSSSPNDDMWDPWENTIADDTTTVLTNQYWQYIATMTTSDQTVTPSIQDVNLLGHATGQFISKCISAGTNPTEWGLFSCADNVTGPNASITYFTRSTPTCAELDGEPWTAQSNDTKIAVDTATVVQYRFDPIITASTETAQVNECSLYWTDGKIAPPTWGVYDSINNSIMWTYAVDDSDTNNRLLKYDLNLRQFYPWSLNFNAPIIVNHELYAGASNGGYWQKFGGVDSDSGTAINAYWQSKDFTAGNPFQERYLNALSFVSVNKPTSISYSTVTYGNGDTDVFEVDISTDSGKAFVRQNYRIKKRSATSFFNFRIGNNAADAPFEFLGIRADFTQKPWRVLNP